MRLLATIAEKFLRAYYNEGFYEFERNGEAFALECFARWRGEQPLVVWDVGANHGQWAEEAHRFLPQATIHSFEILPPIAENLAKTLGASDWAILHRIGLSDGEREAVVSWNRDDDTTSAIAMRGGEFAKARLESVTCKVSTVDRLIAQGLPAPQLLKIDTEGHDAAILRGARDLLSGGDAPHMIQFEYGETWIPACETLERTYKLLEKAGYRIGRLYPTHVDFKPYDYADEHFRMGNMIAARDFALISSLQGS